MSRALEGRAVAVTGGSRGIGQAVVLALAAAGAQVVVNGRESTPVEETVGRVRGIGGEARACVGSVADASLAELLVETCVSEFGGIDVLVNCAGIAEPDGASILDLSESDWRELIDVHLTGTFLTCRHAAPRMAERGAGAIINTSSHAYLGRYGGTGYAAGKGGVNSLTFAMAAELGDRGVRVNAVCPGARSRLNEGPAYVRKIQELHARGILDDLTRDASLEPAAAEHVGPLYVFLASDRAEGINGRLFSAAGGYVGLHEVGSESPLAYRDASEGPWPVEALGAALLERLGER